MTLILWGLSALSLALHLRAYCVERLHRIKLKILKSQAELTRSAVVDLKDGGR